MGPKLKKNCRYIISIFVGILLISAVTFTYAVATSIESSEVIYNNETSHGSFEDVQGTIDELYKRAKKLSGETEEIYQDPILNGADPVLKDPMIPVTIDDDGTVKYASLYSKWYRYEAKKWANAVILVDQPSKNYNTGDVIKEEDIESYFVWIPRYKYKIWDLGEYTNVYTFSDLQDASGENSLSIFASGKKRIIDVVFETKDVTPSREEKVGSYYTHPAFINFDVNGLWVGKFETGYNQMQTTGGPITTSNWTKTGAEKDVVDGNRVIVKPNVYSWRNATVGNLWRTMFNYNRNLDSHMIKNTEWGAVAYLSHSVYGIGTKTNINNYSEYKTGYSAVATTDQSSYPGETGIGEDKTKAYNTSTGYLASTTGNITGVYDMSGGAWEYVAGYTDGYGVTNSKGDISGLTNSELSSNSNYFDKYPHTSTQKSYNNRILGDATGEMGPFYQLYEKDNGYRARSSWYADFSHFLDSGGSWFYRGCASSQGAMAGQFTFLPDTGVKYGNVGSRLVLVVK